MPRNKPLDFGGYGSAYFTVGVALCITRDVFVQYAMALLTPVICPSSVYYYAEFGRSTSNGVGTSRGTSEIIIIVARWGPAPWGWSA